MPQHGLLINPVLSGDVISSFCRLFRPRSAYDRKPTPGFKPLTPPSTPVSPCGPAGSTGAHPLGEQASPRIPQTQTQGRPHPGLQPLAANTGAHNQRPLQLHGQSPPFAVPCPPLSQDVNGFSPEHRYAAGEMGQIVRPCFASSRMKRVRIYI